jgi:hypothetical protein
MLLQDAGRPFEAPEPRKAACRLHRSDALAKDRALELLKDCRFPKVELWPLDRRLYQAAKEQQTAARGVQTRDPP